MSRYTTAKANVDLTRPPQGRISVPWAATTGGEFVIENLTKQANI